MEFLEVALENIAFTLQKNQHLAIAGETGSGKSTLLKIIGGLAAPAPNSPGASSTQSQTPPTPDSIQPPTPPTNSVFFEGRKVLGPLERLIPGEPGIAYLSQHFELWHNYRVAEVLDYNNDLDPVDATHLYQ